MIELRIPESLAEQHLSPEQGSLIGTSVRKLELSPEDPLFERIGRIDREYRARGRAFFTAWVPRRIYSREELEKAQLLTLVFEAIVMVAGEECGTGYDESAACRVCGGGARQSTPLHLDERRIPQNADFARTLAGEWVVSRRAVDVSREADLRGADFEAIRLRNGKDSSKWFQLQVVSEPAELDAATRVGSDPFDRESPPRGASPSGDVAGLNLLSEVWIRGESYHGGDFIRTRQLFGVREGLLRPERLLLLSRRAWSAFREAGLRGFRVEIAHLR